MQKRTLLVIEPQQPGCSITAAPLVLGQRHYTGHVRFRESLNLLGQRCAATAEVGFPCLHLLRQPMSTTGPLHRLSDRLRRSEDLAQVTPDQVFQ